MLAHHVCVALLVASAFPWPAPEPSSCHPESRGEARAAYVAAHRQLERQPGNLPARQEAAQLALEMASPALALDHASFAVARITVPSAQIPFFRQAALAHEAMGEFGAAWNSLGRMAALEADESQQVKRWQADLLALHFQEESSTEMADRAEEDLVDLGVVEVSRLWRAALVDPAAVEVELDRRLADGATSSALGGREAFTLRATLWSARSQSAPRDDAAIESLRSLGPWLARMESDKQPADLQVLAALLRRPFGELPPESRDSEGGAPWLTAQEDEAPAFAGDPTPTLRALTADLAEVKLSLASADSKLDAQLAAEEPPGAEVLESLREAEAALAELERIDLSLRTTVSAVYALEGEAQKLAEALYQALSTTLSNEINPLASGLRTAMREAPARALAAHRRRRSARLLEGLDEDSDPARVLSVTDELVIWTDSRLTLKALHWRARVRALKEAGAEPLSGGVRHALAILAGAHGDAKALGLLAQEAQEARRIAGEATAAYERLEFTEALEGLGQALQLSPFDESLLELHWRWLAAVAGPESGAQALLAWWTSASPLSDMPVEEMELLYRAGEWSGLLSLSEAALKDWPLSSTAYRFHSWAGAALDPPEAEERVHDYLLRSERGVTYAAEKIVRDGLTRYRETSLTPEEWLTFREEPTFSSAALDGVVVAYALRGKTLGRELSLPYRVASPLKKAVAADPDDRLRSMFTGGSQPEELLERGSVQDLARGFGQGDGARAKYFAAAAAAVAGDRAEAGRLWAQCAANPALPALLRTHAAREGTRAARSLLPTVRQRDGIYAGHRGQRFGSLAHGRLIVSRGGVHVRDSGGGAVRFLGVGPRGKARLEFPGETAPLVIVENAAASGNRATRRTTAAWIARGAHLGYSGEILGPVDAESCVITGWVRLLGASEARFEDLLLVESASVEIDRAVSITGMVMDAKTASIRLSGGGSLALEKGLVDLRERAPDSTWLTAPDRGRVSLGITVLREAGRPLVHEGEGVRVVDVAPAAGTRTVTAKSVNDLRRALAEATEGDVIQLDAGTYNLRRPVRIAASVEVVGSPEGKSELQLMPLPAGVLQIGNGACVTLRDVKVANSKEGYQDDPRRVVRRVQVEPGATLLLESARFGLSDRRTATVYVESGGVVAMRAGSAMCRFYTEAESVVAIRDVQLSGAWVDGEGRLAVLRSLATRSGPLPMDVRGATMRVAALSGAYVGNRGGSAPTRMAQACCELRWDAAEEDYDAALPGLTTVKEKAAAIERFAKEIYAAGRVAWATETAMEARLFPRLKRLLEANVKESSQIARALPYYFPAVGPMMDMLNGETRRYLRTSAAVGLRAPSRILDTEYLTNTTEYELAYPLEHPDRRRAMKYLKREVAFEKVAALIAEEKAAEARAEARRRQKTAEAKRAREAALAAIRRQASAEAARARSWRARNSYSARSSYSRSSYVAAPSSYNSSYHSNVAFYSRLNSLSGGGSYRVTASGVTYR